MLTPACPFRCLMPPAPPTRCQGASTIESKFRTAVRAIVSELGPEYLPGLWSPGMASARVAEMEYNALSGFPFCVGKLDAMVMAWRSCPKAAQGQHKVSSARRPPFPRGRSLCPKCA